MKQAVKLALHGVAKIVVLPLLIVDITLSKLLNHHGFFSFCSQLLSLLPGKSGNYLRKAYYSSAMTHCSHDCLIGFATLFSQRDTEILENVYIGPQCNIGKSKIGAACLLGSGVHILSGKNQHHHEDIHTPIQEQGGSYEKINIGQDTWIGNNSVIMANIGKKCIVGAGSVVTKDVPDYSIVAGNPAKIIKSRLENSN